MYFDIRNNSFVSCAVYQPLRFENFTFESKYIIIVSSPVSLPSLMNINKKKIIVYNFQINWLGLRTIKYRENHKI